MLNPRQVAAREVADALLSSAAGVGKPAGHIDRSLQTVVASKSRGLRELLMIVVVARLMDPTFRASRDYGACRPRGLYPGIRAAFTSVDIPHGKDGALNVAKGNPPIDRQWAGARDDKAAADEVVRLVGAIEGMNSVEVEELGAQLARLLLLEAVRVADMNVVIDPSEDPDWLVAACRQMIEAAPDHGNTPQTIVGLLLEAKAAALQAPVRVNGIGDAACVTTSTSNKLGDLCILNSAGEPLVAYEVTVKTFGPERTTDATAAIHDYNVASGAVVTEMTVLCRPEDLHPHATGGDGASAYLGVVDDQDVRYRFIDVFGWIRYELLALPPSGRAKFHSAIATYVNDANTAESVKSAWARINA